MLENSARRVKVWDISEPFMATTTWMFRSRPLPLLVRRHGSFRGSSQGCPRGFHPALFHPGVLRVGACGEMVEIHTAQPALRRSDYRQGPPERQLPEDAERQRFQGLEGAESPGGSAPELPSSHLLA